jgi:hypothetical protein
VSGAFLPSTAVPVITTWKEQPLLTLYAPHLSSPVRSTFHLAPINQPTPCSTTCSSLDGFDSKARIHQVHRRTRPRAASCLTQVFRFCLELTLTASIIAEILQIKDLSFPVIVFSVRFGFLMSSPRVFRNGHHFLHRMGALATNDLCNVPD